MFTIPEQRTKTMRMAPCVQYGLHTAMYVISLLFLLVTTVSAQYSTNGYIFLHPHFATGSWAASTFTSDINVADPIIEDKPVHIAYSRNASAGCVVFTTADSSWHCTSAPLFSNTCICCKPEIAFADPLTIKIPAALTLSASVKFHVIATTSQNPDTVYLAAAASNSCVIVHINLSDGTVGSIDTVKLPMITNHVVSGIWGETTKAGTDTAIWITGSNGLLAKVPINGTTIGNAVSYGLPSTENVTCYGDNLAGTSSGKLYRREGAAFVAAGQTSGAALRFVKNGIAVGDAGSLLILQNGTWESFTKGTADYLAATLTSASGGRAIECVDKSWKYSTHTLFNTATGISSVQPAAVAVGLNNKTFDFNESASTITVKLTDNDGNHVFPTISTKNGSTKTALTDSTFLLRRYDLALCTTTVAQLGDSSFTIALSPSTITLEVPSRKGQFDLSCQIWKWQQSTVKKTSSWKNGDTLIVQSSTDIVKIYNDSQPVTSHQPRNAHKRSENFTISSGHGNQLLFSNCSQKAISSILISNAAGQTLWQKHGISLLSNFITTSPLPSGIVVIRIVHIDGTSSFHKIVRQQN